MKLEERILELLPYDEPFRFVDVYDRITEDYAEGRYRFRPTSGFYAGHFPGNPVTPGVILIETMAQIGLVGMGIYLTGAHERPTDLEFAFTDADVRFAKKVLPGEEVRVQAHREYFRLQKLKCRVELLDRAGERVCHGTLAGVVMKP